jgi:hypothetical protein
MPDYSNGKIYKIVVDTEEEYKPYVGSTIEELSRRMAGHRAGYKYWKNGKGTHVRSYDLFDKFGIESCKIILLEECSCDSKMKLLMKEREWFDKIECCNKSFPHKTEEDSINYNISYRDKNKKILAEKQRVRQQMDASNDSNYYQKKYQKDIDRNPNFLKERYQKYKDKIKETTKEKMTCKCGAIFCKGHKARHERSQKHISFISP